jgi:hypothetical protein
MVRGEDIAINNIHPLLPESSMRGTADIALLIVVKTFRLLDILLATTSWKRGREGGRREREAETKG